MLFRSLGFCWKYRVDCGFFFPFSFSLFSTVDSISGHRALFLLSTTLFENIQSQRRQVRFFYIYVMCIFLLISLFFSLSSFLCLSCFLFAQLTRSIDKSPPPECSLFLILEMLPNSLKYYSVRLARLGLFRHPFFGPSADFTHGVKL